MRHTCSYIDAACKPLCPQKRCVQRRSLATTTDEFGWRATFPQNRTNPQQDPLRGAPDAGSRHQLTGCERDPCRAREQRRVKVGRAALFSTPGFATLTFSSLLPDRCAFSAANDIRAHESHGYIAMGAVLFLQPHRQQTPFTQYNFVLAERAVNQHRSSPSRHRPFGMGRRVNAPSVPNTDRFSPSPAPHNANVKLAHTRGSLAGNPCVLVCPAIPFQER